MALQFAHMSSFLANSHLSFLRNSFRYFHISPQELSSNSIHTTPSILFSHTAKALQNYVKYEMMKFRDCNWILFTKYYAKCNPHSIQTQKRWNFISFLLILKKWNCTLPVPLFAWDIIFFALLDRLCLSLPSSRKGCPCSDGFSGKASLAWLSN